jgi:chorismate-pyruvate lyase
LIHASPVIWTRCAARSRPAMPTLSSRDRICAKRPLGTHLPKPQPMGRRESEAAWHDS